MKKERNKRFAIEKRMKLPKYAAPVKTYKMDVEQVQEKYGKPGELAEDKTIIARFEIGEPNRHHWGRKGAQENDASVEPAEQEEV